MPLYDYRCNTCDIEFERSCRMAVRHEQKCDTCGSPLEKLDRPTPRYKPFNPYFDEGLGEFITGRDHRRRVMKTQGMDFKDHMSTGEISARKDWANERRRERARG